VKRFPEPRKWSIDEIKTAASIARDIYASRRPGEGREAYRAAFVDAVAEVKRLLDESADLISLRETLRRDKSLLDAARYLDAPPISADDLETVSGFRKSTMTVDAMDARAAVIIGGLDSDRFGWLLSGEPREPTQPEREAAVRATAALIAAQRASTVLRNMWAKRQEKAVANILDGSGYTLATRRRIDSFADLPAGMFCPESYVFGQKSDVPVGLRNGRYLLIECKVSGSAVNSYKRLNHETVNKRDTWERGFAAQAYTAAVLGGVFRPANVMSAQVLGVYIFWEHDLAPLADFLEAAG
jgi:Holliday junction resolvase